MVKSQEASERVEGQRLGKIKTYAKYAVIVRSKILKGTDSPTVDIEIYNKRKKEIVAKQ